MKVNIPMMINPTDCWSELFGRPDWLLKEWNAEITDVRFETLRSTLSF